MTTAHITELQLALALPTNTNPFAYQPLKPTFNHHNHTLTTLPLLNWTHKPNDQDDDDPPKDLHTHSSSSSNDEEDSVVGWPPIKNLRKKQKRHHHHQYGFGVRQLSNSNSNSMFVKVKVEGVAIARKIDINLHHSFQSLTSALISMFGLWNEDSGSYELTYLDKEGDWLLAHDVPWSAFVRTVQRLKLLKRSD